MTRQRLMVVLATALTLGAALTGCSQGGVRQGTALSIPGSANMGIVALPPSAKIGVLNLAFYNRSSAPLTITGVRITGTGLGRVARLNEVKVAPTGHDPGALYVTDPPVYHFLQTSPLGPAGCNVQALRSPSGYVLPPGNAHGWHNVYIWAVVRMMHPGRYRSQGSTVYYTQQGTRYRDFVALGFSGSVARAASWPVPYLEKGCLSQVHLLNPGHD